MKQFLVGYTGFVGSNIAANADFDGLFNSKNIQDAFGSRPDLLVYAGVPAEKFFANSNPEKDLVIINTAIDNILKINPSRLVLISTVDVYKSPQEVYERTRINTSGLCPYGLNRYHLEQSIRNIVKETFIIRLPALFGINLKKNFIYDLINIIPAVLSEKKLKEVSVKSERIGSFYIHQDNGFFKCKLLSRAEKAELRKCFLDIGFTALDFTDSRAKFQFYNLSYLRNHIELILDKDIRMINMATEPVSASDVYESIRGERFTHEFMKDVPEYNLKTEYAKEFGGKNGYIFSRQRIINELKAFVEREEAE